MAQESFVQLLREANEMLRDRPKPEADLIYHVAKLDSEARAAIIMGYDMIYKEYKE